jgi:hypothetical protein
MTMGTLIRTLGAAGLLVVSVLPSATTVEAGPAPVPRSWGWLVARQPSTLAYVPASADQGNSGGHIDRVERIQLGNYYAIFNGIGNGFYPIGIVSALSSGPRSCMIDDNFGSGVGVDTGLEVDCFDRAGTTVDAKFVANIVIAGDGPTGDLGYTWADQETTPDYTGASYYSYVSSSGDPVSIHRAGVGSYEVTFPGLGRRGGNAQVSAAKGGPPALCKVLALTKVGDDERIAVRCRDTAGQLVDADFMVIYTNRVGLTGVPGRKAAHLLADRPTAERYEPSARYRYSSAGTIPVIRRSSTGRYRVTLPGMPLGGSAQVTAYGSGPSVCQPTSIRKDGLPQRIRVACFGPDGTPIDSRFLLSYTR